jgi:Mg2+-importing ATPase
VVDVRDDRDIADLLHENKKAAAAVSPTLTGSAAARNAPRPNGIVEALMPRAAPARPCLRVFALIANALAPVLILVAIVGFKEEHSIVALIGAIEPRWVAAALLLQAATYLATGGAWRAILARFRTPLPLAEVALLAVEKLAFDQLFPTLGVGGSVIVIRSLTRRGVSAAEALAVIMIDALCFYAAYLSLFGLSAALLFAQHGLGPAARSVVLAFFALLGGAIAAICFLIWRLRTRGTLGWLARFSFARERAREIAELPPGAFAPHSSWALAALLEASVFLLDAVTLWALFAALHYPLSFTAALVALMFSAAAAALSFVPGGLGFFEGAGILVIHQFGLPYGAATAGILLLRGFTYWLPMLPGYLILRRELAAPAR